jgi:hypothetical protein
VPLNPNALWMTSLGQNWIDVLCTCVEMLLQTDGPIEMD